MRFELDLVWLDREGRVLGVDEGVPPRRVRARRGAAAVVEVPAGLASEIIPAMAERERNRLAVALDPRQPIYRDTYNEYFVLVLSAGGAAAGTQVPLYIVMAITGLWDVLPFVAACVLFELVVIFGLARPQMAPRERAGWAALWGATTAVLAFAFYHLVASPTL
jgi:VIT1/CCC1 family predicted Fe2+/Mn2+ transporter